MAKINQLPPLTPVREVVLITEEVAELIGVGEEGSEEPKDEEPKDEEPKDEEPKDEEPKDEEPKDEEPKDEEQGA